MDRDLDSKNIERIADALEDIAATLKSKDDETQVKYFDKYFVCDENGNRRTR